MRRPNVADWQYLGVDKITRRLDWNSGRKARKGHICDDSLAYASYSIVTGQMADDKSTLTVSHLLLFPVD